MKIIFGLLLLMSFIDLQAGVIKVKEMSNDGDMEGSFVLKTNLSEKVVIDCQSFIQGLRIGEYERAYVYMLDSDECEGLQFRIKSSLDMMENHCIDVDREIRSDYGCEH